MVKIALVHRPSGSNYKVAIQDINTGIVNILTPTSLDESPSFSPNGQMVVYATREGTVVYCLSCPLMVVSV